ncbi:helicase C-terminal domain-containing protein [Alkalibacterium sp.]|nr:MAG: hypothetical protein EA249_04925 [Alkalibacterium sp.]
MKKDQLYAIVDIEATGASIGKDERMIQFACVLMKNGEVVEEFDTYINPSRKVSPAIRQLTGIRAKDLATAPYFEDIAHIIHNLLEDTIFVAHNVGFDYQFLNECLTRVAMPKLTIPAIDTVELAQILFPQEDSYQLKELTASLGYVLKNAHNALFDAQATAFLLKQLDKKLSSLPLVTLESLSELADCTTAQTALFFTETLKRLKDNPGDLDDSLMIVNGLALKKPQSESSQIAHRNLPVYPYKKTDKEALFEKLGLNSRVSQFSLMNDVFNYLKNSQPDFSFLVEAAPGSGKTFGYLLPAFYLATPEDKLVISTYTKVLQKQLVDESLPFFNSQLEFSQSVALAKSPSHYVSLSAFYRKWKNTSETDTEAQFCMRVLVWLTETSEGDLEEIGVGPKTPHPFWQEIKPTPKLHPLPEFEPIDFIKRREEKLASSSIIVTNHAYLVANGLKEQPPFELNNVILDEAHHFPDVIEQSATLNLRVSSLTRDLKRLGTSEKEESLLFVLADLKDSKIKEYQLNTLESVSQVLLEEWEEWSLYWISWLMSFNDYDKSVIEWKEKPIDLNTLPMQLKKDTRRLVAAVNEYRYVAGQLTQLLDAEQDALSKDTRRELMRLQVMIDHAEGITEAMQSLFFSNEKGSQTGIRFYSKNPTSTLTFYRFNQESKVTILNQLNAVKHLVLASSTLSVNNSPAYISQALSLKNVEFSQYDSPYQFSQQGRIFVPVESSEINHSKKAAYVSVLANQIEQILTQTNENALVLFRSQEIIQAVYTLLKRRGRLKNKTLLAQNISGTPVKIAKQVKKSDQVVVLGADSFWEGVDFPEDELRLVILTRLPFDSPDMPLVKNRHRALSEKGFNPFVHDLLPRAVMRFKQGIGRLIRSEKDRGIWIVLDRRMIESSYSSAFIDSLPKGLKIEELPLERIIEESQSFFDTDS